MNMYHRIIYLIIAAFFPLIASAQLGGGEYDRVIEVLTRSLNLAIVFLFLVATVILIWGIVKYIGSGGDEAKREEAHNLIIWGIIFLAVMVAVWGFVYIVLDFIFDRESPVDIPGGTSGVPQQR